MCNHGQFYVSLLIKAEDFFYIVRRKESVSSARSDHRLAKTTSVLQEAKTVADYDFVEHNGRAWVTGMCVSEGFANLTCFLTYPNTYTSLVPF